MVTLKTLAQATAQEVFDHVASHLLTQGKKSKNSDCAYRSPEGLSCAAGCLISDEEYDSKIEGITWTGLARRLLVPDRHKTLISNLQSIHDGTDVKNWFPALTTLAHRSGLNANILQNFKNTLLQSEELTV